MIFSKLRALRPTVFSLEYPKNGQKMRKDSIQLRRALVAPRFLFGAAALLIGGATWMAAAQSGQNSRPPVKMITAPSASKSGASKSNEKPVSLADLPAMIERYGAARQNPTKVTGATGAPKGAVGTGESGFNLVETDLTPNSPSDEREPAYSPGGDFILFRSNGADTNNDGAIDAINTENKTHIWVMNRDGSAQRQVTGKGADRTRNQRRPSWSPDANTIVYVDDVAGSTTTTQLYLAFPSEEDRSPEQLTFFPGRKEAPAWNPNGLTIAFVSNYDARPGTASNARALSSKDIFTLDTAGNIGLLERLTGGTSDPIGNQADDSNPAYSAINGNILFFSSNRDANGLLTGDALGGRRIWRMSGDGTKKLPFSNPTFRTDQSGKTVGRPNDIDDFPATSLSSDFDSNNPFNFSNVDIGERVAFQTNTYLDSTDDDEPQNRDLNIWSLPFDSTSEDEQTESTESRIFVSSYVDPQPFSDSDPAVLAFNTKTGKPAADVPVITDAEVVGKPEGLDVFGGYVYVSDRTGNRVLRFLERDGSPAGDFGAGFSQANVPSPSGLVVDGAYIYVNSGNGGGAASPIYRFNRFDGSAAGTDFNSGNAAFSFGESTEGKVSNGAEGIATYPFSVSMGLLARNYLFVSALFDNKINIYDQDTGQFVRVFVAPGSGNLLRPTGLTWGADINGDDFLDLYVSSSGNNSVKVFAGFDPSSEESMVGSGGDVVPGSFLGDVVPNGLGGLISPEGLKLLDRNGDGKVEIYVSSFGSEENPDKSINRYEFDSKAGDPPTGTDLQGRVATPKPRTGLEGDPKMPSAAWITGGGLNGPSYFDFNAAASAGTETVIVDNQDEKSSNSAIIVTNILSSPKNFTQSRLAAPNTIDRAADREPTFSRLGSTPSLLARLALSSTRIYASNTATNNNSNTPQAGQKSNPFGGNQLNADGTTNAGPTHDIWSVSTQDTTPPTLVPQGAGNSLTPVVAPGPQAPFFAPRTFEQGLRPGASAGPTALTGDANALRLAVVIRDVESGLETNYSKSAAVTASFYQASKPAFLPRVGTANFGNAVNDKIVVDVRQEIKSAAININGRSVFKLRVYDDGPTSSGGHEKQAAAVAGDGNYYCEGVFPTPTDDDDFYLDINVTDRRGNAFVYDNIWGFSTRAFQRMPNVKSDLLVADYLEGQNFPAFVSANTFFSENSRFSNMPPVESYWLSNPGDQKIPTDAKNTGDANNLGASIPYSFNPATTDVWRVLSRGAIPQTILDSYRPRITKQIDPNDSTSTFVEKNRDVAVSERAVIWAAPYAGTSFVGPGTIADPIMQARLTQFLNGGGRLFIAGRDIAWALSNNGTLSNDFLNTELAAKFDREVNISGQNLTAAAGKFTSYFVGSFDNIQITSRFPAGNNPDEYNDGALTQGAGGFAPPSSRADIILPQTVGDAPPIPSYTFGGGVLGQRIVKKRATGIESRAVYFSFGFEAINRRYTTNKDQGRNLNTRFTIAQNILSYFKTGSASGKVTNSDTTQPVANFLVVIEGPGGPYYARTDVNGNFELSGLPPGSYTLRPYTKPVGGEEVTDPQGFSGGTPQGFGILSGELRQGLDLIVTPAQPGTLSGRATSSNSTPSNIRIDGKSGRSDDVPLANTPVLLYSVEESSIFPGGGRFAALTTTDAGGRYSFSAVPARTDLVVVFNPNQSDIPKSSNLTAPPRNPSYGRRVVPDIKRPVLIAVPEAGNFILNDIIPITEDSTATTAQQTDDRTENGVPIVVPNGPSIVATIRYEDPAFVASNLPTTVTVVPVSVANAPQASRLVQTGTAATAFSFEDFPSGKYLLRAVVTLPNGAKVNTFSDANISTSEADPFTLSQGTDANVPLYLLNAVGRVVRNNAPLTKPATITLTDTGAGNNTTRTFQTQADGTYRLTLIGPGNYRVSALQDGITGKAGVKIGVAPVGGQTTGGFDFPVARINLSQIVVAGRVLLRPGGSSALTPLGGTRVQLFREGATTALRTTTSAADGTFSLPITESGTFYVVGTYPASDTPADRVQSGIFTVQSDQAPNPVTLVIRLQQITVNTVDSSGNALSGVRVDLFLRGGTSVVATGVSQSGQVVFDQVVGAAAPDKTDYDVRASFNGASGSEQVSGVQRGNAPRVVTVTLFAEPVEVDTTTTFAIGKTYLISLPYQTSTNATRSNVSPSTLAYNGVTQSVATIAVGDAFSAPPSDSGGTYYQLSEFNPQTLRYDTLSASSVLKRGVGYRLQTLKRPANTNITLKLPGAAGFVGKALTDSAFKSEFIYRLTYLASQPGTPGNGRNLIGFGFDPAQFGTVEWNPNDESNTSVQVVLNGETYSLRQAVQRKLISQTLETIDASTGQTVSVSSLSKYGGYFVQTFVDGLRLVLHPSRGVNITPGSLTIDEGSTGTFSVRLNQRPTANVTLQLSSSNGTVASIVGDRTLVFTPDNFNTAQTVTIRGVTDRTATTQRTASIITSATSSTDASFNGVSVADVQVTVRDDKGAFNVVLNRPQLQISEDGATDSFAVSLFNQPTENVTITLNVSPSAKATLSTGNAPGTSSQVTLTFTPINYANTQIVTVTGRDDNIADSPQTFTVTGTVTTTDAEYSQRSFPTINGVSANKTTDGGGGGGTPSGETFAANGTYSFSVPFASTTEASSTVDSAQFFDQAMFSGSGERRYFLYRFDVSGQRNNRSLGADFVEVGANEKLVRGLAYRLVTIDNPVTIRTPVSNTALKAFTGTSFSFNLTRNTNFANDVGQSQSFNGYNFIGFPFNPGSYNRVPFETARVVSGGNTYESVTEAAAAGVISNRLFTVDNNGNLVQVSTDDAFLRPYRGYFVQVFRDQVTLTLRNPTQ